MRFREPGIHQNRNQYGCRAPDGRNDFKDSGVYKIPLNGFSGSRQILCHRSDFIVNLLIKPVQIGINAVQKTDSLRLMGEMILKTAEYTKEQDSLGCAKLVVFCNAPDDNPFMAGAFHGVTEADAIINVGVSGPGVVKHALKKVRGESFEAASIIP